MDIPQRRCKPPNYFALDALKIRNNEHQSSTRFDEPQVHGDDSARIVKMFDQTGGVNHVKGTRGQRGPEEVLADYMALHSLKRQIRAQQQAAGQGESLPKTW